MNEWQFVAVDIVRTGGTTADMEIFAVTEAQLATLTGTNAIDTIPGQPTTCAIESQIMAPNTAADFLNSKSTDCKHFGLIKVNQG